MYGNIEPTAVIVCSAGGSYALDIESRLIHLEQLRQNIPGLDALIESFESA